MARRSGAAGALGATGAVRATRAVSAPRGVGSAGAARRPASPAQLDRVIHDRTRLAIMSALAINDALSFNELKALTSTTDGNLSVHARKLEDAGYVLCEKSFAGRTPRTDFRISASGRRAFEKYLDHMDALIKATRKPRP